LYDFDKTEFHFLQYELFQRHPFNYPADNSKIPFNPDFGNPLIFHINMDFGHGGASGRFDYIKDIALEYAFIFDQIGMKE
jgi:hypothetical protein